MADPNARPADADRGTSPTESAPGAQPSSHIIKLAANDLLLGGSAEPTDDTPTVISRLPLADIRSDEAFAGMLRGRHLAHFELLGPIGVGGMAAVLRARDTQLDRIVALKILPPEMANDPEIVRRFHQEARAAAKLDHENIARVYFCGDDQGLHFIAFELVEGENLKTLLEQRGRIPVPEAIGYMLQIATGLAHASARGVVHRDIKPSNIIISSNGRAKLVDMGLARSLDPQADGALTQSGVTLGTFDYISPEQALEPRDADVRSDIYSLGCTFYHMLTGQAPVPEGTAAKKLHHHQSVDPPDPRQLNPQIPDEVAALLARMMAKDPKDRYQRPEPLVQHLIVLAQKLGTVSEVPDAVLFVDAPMLGQPRARPLLIAGLAGLVLVVVVVMFGPPSDQRPQVRKDLVPPVAASSGAPQPAPARESGTDSAPPANLTERKEPSSSRPEPVSYHASDVKGLAEFLGKTLDARVYLSRSLKLTRDDPPLVFQGRTLTIEPEEDAVRNKVSPAFALDYDANPGGNWTILKLLAGNVTIRGLRFELNAHGAEIQMTGIDWQGGTLLVDNCSFSQEGYANTQRERVASISISGRSERVGEPAVNLQSCYFAGGEDALFLTGPGGVHASQCAFAPHANALFELGKKFNQADPHRTIMLANCSAFIGGSAFQVDDGVEFSVRTENCVFSRPQEAPGDPGSGVLIEQIGSLNPASSYKATGNCYHNLNAYWSRSVAMENRVAVTSLDDFKRRSPLVREERPFEAATSPLAEAQPLRTLEQEQPRRAFVLRTDIPALRQARNDKRMIGVEHCLWEELYTDQLPPLERRPSETVARNQRIVDPSAELKANVYRKLSQAVDDAQPGDVILIRHSGLLREDPVQVKDANANLTIRPYPNSHPILTIAPSTEPDAALIKVHDGKITLENLEFRLDPDQRYRSQSVATIMADGQCTFNNCSATLEAREGTNLSLVTLNDPSVVMKMIKPAQQEDPRIILSGCFVRGTGQLLAVRVSRPFDLKAEDSLVALNGSMVVIEGSPKDPKDAAGSRSANITLSHLTTYLTEHLILVRALKERSTGLKVKSASDCIFAAAGAKSLIHLEGIESEDEMKNYFSWIESQHNAFGNYTQYLEQQSAADSMPQPALTLPQWKDFTRDSDSKFDKVRFGAAPLADSPMSRVSPADFKTRPEANLQGFGAYIERLPTPSQQNGTSSTDESSPEP